MARATRIYFVHVAATPAYDMEICGAFTVRHECITWLEQQPVRNLASLRVATIPDGVKAAGDTRIFDAVHFMEGAR